MAHRASASGPWSLRNGGLAEMTIGLEHTVSQSLVGDNTDAHRSSSESPSPPFVILSSPPQGHRPLTITAPSLQALGLFQPSLVSSSQEQNSTTRPVLVHPTSPLVMPPKPNQVCEVPHCSKWRLSGPGRRCSAHGGGYRCQSPACTNCAVSGGLQPYAFCYRHDGGATCSVQGCITAAKAKGM